MNRGPESLDYANNPAYELTAQQKVDRIKAVFRALNESYAPVRAEPKTLDAALPIFSLAGILRRKRVK